jgi:hypothetical protein
MRAPVFPLTLLALLGALSSSLAQDALGVPEDQQIEEALQSTEAPVEPEAAVNPNPLSSLDLESLSATRSAPLFTPSRTGPIVEAPIEAVAEAPPPPPEVPPEQAPPALQLVGIVLTDAAQTALLKDPGSNEIHRLNSGDEYEGWSVTIVDARSIEFRSGDRVEALKMFESFPTPASYGMSGELPFDPAMSEMGGQPPPDQQLDGMPPEEIPLEGIPPEDVAPGAGGAVENPPQNFDPQTGELLPIPEEGPLPVDGDAPAQQQ